MSFTDGKSRQKPRHTQYPLPFTVGPDVADRSPIYRFSPANERARKLFDIWCEEISNQSGQGIIITGPPASGKTFLTGWVANRLEAACVTGNDLEAVLAAPGEIPIIIVDDVERVTEPALVTRFIDVSLEKERSFVLTGNGKPESWAHAKTGPLTDLVTRLAAMPEASLDSPDEDLMAKVLQDWLQSRQIVLRDDLAAIAVTRVKRSFLSLKVFADQLDAEAMQRQKSIDKTTIQFVLDSLPEHILS